MNKISYFCHVLLAFQVLLFHEALHAVKERDDFDDLIALVDNSPEITNLITASSSAAAVRQSSKVDIIGLLDNLGILALIQENFFLRTNNLNTRSLLDYPEFIPFRHDRDKRAIYVDLFYNQTSRMKFTGPSGNICSYLAVSDPEFLAKFKTVVNRVKDLFPEIPINTNDILRVFNLFQTFTVQQRRLGLMIGGKTTFNRWHFNIMAPWYYLERNHFVDEKIKENLETLFADLAFDLFGIPRQTPAQIEKNENATNRFIDQHFISDKFGFGDTRIYLDYPIIKKKFLSSRAGFLATIPTAFALKKGVKGSHLHRVINRPLIDFLDIFDVAISQQKVSPALGDLGLLFLDNLSAILLDTPMGNSGHFGLGFLVRNRSPLSSFIKLDWAQRFIMRSFISLEYQFPALEWRSFRIPVNEALFNAHNFSNTEDPLIVNENFAFIEQQIVDRLFPVALQTRVNPGVILRWSSQFCYEGDNAGFTFGTDTYVRNKENLSSVQANPITRKMIAIANAQAPLSYQSKAVGSVFFKVEKPDRLYTIALCGDYTFMSRGIGQDFTLALNFDVTF